MPVRYWQIVLLILIALYGLSGYSDSYKYDDNSYRPLGDPQAVNHRK
jgi:hypothetical protein